MPDVTDLVSMWELKSSELTQTKKDELALRKQVIDLHFPDLANTAAPKEGTHTEDIIVGANKEPAVLTVTQPYSYKVDDALPDEYRNAAVFRHKIELEKKTYNKFTETQKKGIQQWLTIKPGQASLKIKHAEEET